MRKTAALIGLACAVAFGKTHDLETAKVISQEIKSHQVERGVMTGTPLVRYSNVVVIETAQSKMTLAEMSSYFSGTKTQDVINPVALPVHGSVEIKRDGNYVFVFDEDHKKHKFAIMHLEALDTAPTQKEF